MDKCGYKDGTPSKSNAELMELMPFANAVCERDMAHASVDSEHPH
jgi:hypothetical protein